MPESENTVGKSWLTEGVILLLTPALAYFLAFQYECGYCHTFGLPPYFIKPDLTEILIFATVTMGYAILCFWVLNAWLDLGTKKDPQLFPGQQLIRRYFPFFTLLAVIIIVYNSFWRKSIWMLLAFAVFPLWDIINASLLGPKGKTFAEKWAQTNIWAEPSGLFFKIRSRLGRTGALLLAMVFLGAMLAAAMGNSEALHQESFLVPSSNTNAIVIRCYGDKFICVTIDPSTKRPTKTFFLLPMTSEQNVQFSLQRIGPLNLELFYQDR